MTGPEPARVAVCVVGGGISGLAAAWFAARTLGDRGSVAVLESGGRVGGKVDATEVAGIPVPAGADSFLARVPWAIDLARDLGLGDELVPPGTGEAWMWTRGRLRRLPEGIVLGAPSRLRPLARSGILSPAGLLRAALDEVVPRRPPGPAGADEPVGAAVGRHLGRQVVERLLDPLVGGINAGDCDHLSLAVSAAQLADAARSPRMMRALRAAQAAAQAHAAAGGAAPAPVFLTPRSGITTLTERLAAALPAGAVRTASPVTALERTDAGWVVRSPAGDVHADHVVLATPAYVSAELVRPHAPAAAWSLAGVDYASVVLTVLAYPRAATTLPPGSGMLVPRVDGRLLTAASWWDQKWPHAARPDHTVVRASAGRVGDSRALDLDDAELVERVHAELREAVGGGLAARPADARVVRWLRAFPQYEPGHLDRTARIERALAADAPGLSATGAWARGVGLATCIREAGATVTRALAGQS